MTLFPPVDGPIVSHFEAPTSTFGPGHRGIDYGIPEGSPVRAAGAGVVTFAGSVAGDRAVTIDHGEGLTTTYSILGSIRVRVGEQVTAGRVIGTSSVAHPEGRTGLHFGVKLHGRYVDPAGFLTPVDVSSAIRLAPVEAKPLAAIGIDVAMPTDGPRPRACVERYDLDVADSPPNDNVAVAIAGINSSSGHAEIFESPPELLGYRPGDVYRFSYKGVDGARFHTPYGPSDTWGDLRVAAGRLGLLLQKIARLHPGRGVDLIAHSQGGLVARAYLELMAGKAAGAPHVENLVTFATPHEGAPLAREATQLRSGLGYSYAVGRGLAEVARRQWAGIPDIFSTAVSQIAEGSDLVTELAVPDTLFGTRYLSLAAPGDLIVPATKTQVDGALNRTVRFEWTPSAHSSIVASTQARGMAHAFLRGAAEPCRGSSENWGGILGGMVAAGESVVAEGIGIGTSFVPGSLWVAAAHGGARVAGDPSTAGATAATFLQGAIPARKAFERIKGLVARLERGR